MNNSDQRIMMAALCRIATLAFDPESNFSVPHTTLSHDVTADNGTWTIQTTDDPKAAGFRKYQLLSFWDGAGVDNTGGILNGPDSIASDEEFLAISEVDSVAKTITVDSNGIGYNGFQYAHSSGAIVAANLATETIDESQPAVSPVSGTGYPLIWVAASEEAHRLVAVHQDAPLLKVAIQYTRNLLPREGSVNAIVYSRRQQIQARADMNAIKAMLMVNRQLPLNGFAQCSKLGALKGQSPDMQTGWSRYIERRESDLFTISTELLVTDIPGFAT